MILTIACLIFTFTAAAYRHNEIQTKAHEIAELARSMGLSEDNPIIVEASRIWWAENEADTTETKSAAEEVAEKETASLEGVYYTNLNTVATMIAKTIYGEARGTYSITEQACIIWTMLNRVDAGYGTLEEVITAKYQFAYRSHFPTTDDYGRDLTELAKDVISRWEAEKAGEADVGRVLPQGYLWYSGDGHHNYFRNSYSGSSQRWDYSLPSPYET